MFVKPKDGLKIPDTLRGDYLPPEGREIGDPTENGFFWHRRIEEGNVTVLDEAAAKKSLDDAEDARKAALAEVEKTRRAGLTDEQRKAEDESARRAALTPEARAAEDAKSSSSKKG